MFSVAEKLENKEFDIEVQKFFDAWEIDVEGSKKITIEEEEKSEKKKKNEKQEKKKNKEKKKDKKKGKPINKF